MNEVEFEATLFCSTRATPEVDPVATFATTCPSLQLTTEPSVLPSQTVPLPWDGPKPEPVMVTGVFADPAVGETPVTMGAAFASGALTVTPVLPVMPLKAAVTLAVPDEAGITIGRLPGISITVATELFEEAQVTSDVRFRVLPSAYVPVAVNCKDCVEPIETMGLDGIIAIETRPAVTVTSVEAVIVPADAVMVVVPELSAFTMPAVPAALLTVATEGKEEVQITDCSGICELFRTSPELL